VSNIDGKWCIKSGADQLTSFKGLLLSRSIKFCCITLNNHCSWKHSLIVFTSDNLYALYSFPERYILLVPLNDELQQARESVAKAEADVLSMLTEKVVVSHNEISFHWPYNNFTPYVFHVAVFSAQMQMDLDDIEKLLKCII
jgi:hypothetical protein